MIDFVTTKDIRFRILIDNGGIIFRELKIRYFPTKMIVENGVIKKTWVGSSPDIETLLRELNMGEIK